MPCPRPEAKLLGIRRAARCFRSAGHVRIGRAAFRYLESFFRGDRYIYYAELRESAESMAGPRAVAGAKGS